MLPLILAVLVGAGALVYWSYRAEIDNARTRIESGGRVISTALGAVQFAEFGRGMPLLSIHGAGGGYDQGLDIAADLVGSGYRVIAPSRFGYLGTPVPPDPSDAAQADMHAALLDALKIEKAIVIGTSAGARSAIELALRHSGRVTAIVLIVPATYSPASLVSIEGSRASKFAFWLVNSGAEFAWWSLERIAPSILVRFLGVSPAVLRAASQSEKDRVLHIMKSVQPLSRRFRGVNLDTVSDLHPIPLDAIRVPTMVVTTRDDLFNTLPAAEFAARSIPAAKLEVFETGGHLLVGREAGVKRAVANFIDGTDAQSLQP
ncbi:alpha/beta hydrolase [Bradyrhizobium centrolobii]|uniref:alpha/beta hydrolase n=1 Tax=Bradyrhizobium centrolobii TaxID=1505087 RepID=UPI0009ED0B6A|nr:alpha/beta hydrolase [Bradyrhizobium centrolobii]